MLTKIRHDIHKHPEIAYTEYRTREIVRDFFTSRGVTAIRDVAKTGLQVDLVGEAPAFGNKRCVAYRTELDALPMQEETDVPYKSENGNMHA